MVKLPSEGPSPAELLAEAPEQTHPVIVRRVAQDLATTRNLVACSMVSVIAQDEVFSEAQQLAEVLDSMIQSAERQRQLADRQSVSVTE